MASTRIVLIVYVALLFAAGAYAYPKELIGTWVGSCQQVGYTNITGMNTICTGSPKVLNVFPYTISYMVMKSKTVKGGMDLMYSWSSNAVIIQVMMGNKSMQVYQGAYMQNMTYALAHAVECGPSTYCITSKPPGEGPVAFLTSVMQIGAQMTYLESGMFKTSNGRPLKMCPMDVNMPLYCNEETYNYECTATKVMMSR